MNAIQHKHVAASCRCGKVEFEMTGAPIVCATCYCTSCQEAGGRFEQIPVGAPVLDTDGGTGFILFRKDRVRCTKGADQLQEHRLKPESTTRRVLATCCNSAMFLEMTNGHWLSMYRNRFSDDAPPLEIRTMTRDRRAGVELADDVPNCASHNGKFMWKLLAAWIAMGFRRPKINYVKAA